MSELFKELSRIQQALKAPKGQVNDFGKYNYRSCEDILEAVKPLLGLCSVVLSDEIVHIDGRFYVKATAQLINGSDSINATAYAREPDNKKGMDLAQLTGATSSYARKYALNGLFCIDDTKDADTMDNSTDTKPKSNESTPEQRKYAAGLMTKKGFTPEQAKIWLGDNFQRSKLAELSGAEISKAIKLLISNVVN